MISFIEGFDEQSYKRIKSIQDAISVKDPAVVVSMQSFFENILKLIVIKKEWPHKNFESLSTLLMNQKLMAFLKGKLNFFAFSTLEQINSIANTHKHERVYQYNDKEVRKYFKCVFYLAKAIYNYYFDDKIEIEFPEATYEKLINESKRKEAFLKEEIEKARLDEQTKLSKKIESIIHEKNAIAQKLLEAEQEKEKKDALLKAYREKEISFNESKQEIERLTCEYNKLKRESQDQLSNSILYDTYKTLEDFKIKNKDLENEIKTLKLQVDGSAWTNIERLQFLLNAKNEEIADLTNKLKGQETPSSSLYEKYLKSISSISFGNSYLQEDVSYLIYNLSAEEKCLSKYVSFYAVINNILQRNRFIEKSKYLEKQCLSDEETRIVGRLEALLLTLVRNGQMGDSEWKINYLEGRLDLLQIAINNIFTYLESLCQLAKVDFERPQLTLDNKDYQAGFLNIKYDNYCSYDKNVFLIKDDYAHQDAFNIWLANKIRYQVSVEDEPVLLMFLHELFGHSNFRPGQLNILLNVLNGRNTIGILPTAGGKSLIFQFAALLQPKITIIIAPINSLIRDQVNKLKEKYRISSVLAITGDAGNVNKLVQQFKNADALYVFISPERLQSARFRDTLIALRLRQAFDFVVLDEVHCLSEWGHDFRIPFLMLSHTLHTYCGDLQYLGLTATASINVVRDLQVELRIESPHDILFSKKLKRENLEFKVLEFPDASLMLNHLKTTVNKNYRQNNAFDIALNKDDTNAMIVFLKTKKEANLLAQSFSEIYALEVGVYHGDKKDEQDNFMENKKSLLFATKAFGMGIDKPNIRTIFHYGLPSSREQYYQEAGRSGRDGKKASCFLLTYANNFYENDVRDFLDLNASVSEMIDISKKISRKTDMSTNFYFLVEGLNEPETETKYIVMGFSRLKMMLNERLLVSSPLKDKNEAEKIFYMLHKIGIIDNWTITYHQGFENVNAVIKFNEKYLDIEHIKITTLKYLSLYANAKHEIEQVRKITSYNQLEELILIVRSWYHRTFIHARREQLANIYSFAKKYQNIEASDAIQNELEQFFDISSLIDRTEEGYSLTLEDETIMDVVEKAALLPAEKVAMRAIELERLLESTTNNNIELYTAIINLRNDTFKERNGEGRLIHVINSYTNAELKVFLKTAAIILYPRLKSRFKIQLLWALYNYNKALFKKHFLKEIRLDQDNISYAFLFINKALNELVN